MNYLDLFAGTGAFSHVLDKKGFQCVLANDLLQSSKEIYTHNYPQHPFVLRDLNDMNVSSIPKHDILCAGFPCFVEGTMVLTNNGYQAIEKISFANKLLTHKGSFQSIVTLQKKLYTGKLYKFLVNHQFKDIICTAEHPFYVRTKRLTSHDPPEWKKASDITSDDYFGMVINKNLMIPTFSLEHVSITIDNKDMWFMMGCFVGNGWVEKDTCKIMFCIENKDEKRILFRIRNFLNIEKSDKNNVFGCHDDVWLNILQHFVKFFDEKKIPEWVQDAPDEFIKEFLDGYVSTTKVILSYDLALGLQRLYFKIGSIVNMDKWNGSYRLCHIKNQCAFIDGNYAWFPQKSQDIGQVMNKMVYNFEVEHDNSYIVSNIIVHNCQPFSIAGKREGFEDPRSNVFWKIIEIVQHHTPSFILLENVKNLKTHQEGQTFTTILSSLVKLGYYCKYEIVDTAKITHVPQHRERIYLVAFRDKDLYNKFHFDFQKVATKPISDFLEKNVPDHYYYTDKFRVFPIIQASITKSVYTTNTLYQYRRHYVRENKKNQCPTLTANMGSGGHNVPLLLDSKGIRKLTPRECFNLQGFPTNYHLPTLSDSLLYKLAGNAVSIPVVELIIDRLLEIL